MTLIFYNRVIEVLGFELLFKTIFHFFLVGIVFQVLCQVQHSRWWGKVLFEQ